MEDTDIRLLEILLGKLRLHLGHKFLIGPEAVHDGSYLAIYEEDGTLIKKTIAHDLKAAIEEIKKKEIIRHFEAINQ